ncbi:flavin-containing monooxygenase [Leucobacter komagatae]|uniref:flavin-containing monooxygenase n=1 Tax=Leucobacter komagatae TaxID=55969 RepID=UPI0026B2390C
MGGGQSGLAVAYELARAGLDYQVFECGIEIGASWTTRWDSLRLFTPSRFAGLPGQPFPGARWSHPGKGEVAEYLRGYREVNSLNVRTGAEVKRLVGALGHFALTLESGEVVRASRVVVATGPFAVPVVPADLGRVAADVSQIHSSDYRRPSLVSGERVLVVGGGNSGCQIARELAGAGRKVMLAEGRRLPRLPQRVLGRDIFWWLATFGLMRVPVGSWLGRRMRAVEPVIGQSRVTLRQAGESLRNRVASIDGNCVSFAAGPPARVDAIIWATGFRADDRWVKLPQALDSSGALRVDGLRSAEPGLYVLGRSWQTNRGSALLGFVGRDAHALVRQLVRDAQRDK